VKKGINAHGMSLKGKEPISIIRVCLRKNGATDERQIADGKSGVMENLSGGSDSGGGVAKTDTLLVGHQRDRGIGPGRRVGVSRVFRVDRENRIICDIGQNVAMRDLSIPAGDLPDPVAGVLAAVEGLLFGRHWGVIRSPGCGASVPSRRAAGRYPLPLLRRGCVLCLDEEQKRLQAAENDPRKEDTSHQPIA